MRGATIVIAIPDDLTFAQLGLVRGGAAPRRSCRTGSGDR